MDTRGMAERGSVRGLNARQWADVDRAARIARSRGVRLTVHGVTVEPTGAGALPQEQPRQDARTWNGLQTTAATASPQQPPPAAARPQPTLSPPGIWQQKRRQRSEKRRLEHQQKQRRVLLSSSQRVQRFLRQFRWQKMQSVWTDWMAQQQFQEPEQKLEPEPEQKPVQEPEECVKDRAPPVSALRAVSRAPSPSVRCVRLS